MSDFSKAAISAAELIDSLAKDYPDDDVKIGMVAIVVEITGIPESGDDDDAWTGIYYRCTDNRRWIQVGLFEAARRAALASFEDAES